VTVNPVYKSHELAYVIKQSDMKALVIIDAFRDVDYVQIVRELVPESLRCERGHLETTEFPQLKSLIYMGPEKHRGMYTVPELLLLGDLGDDEEYAAAQAVVGNRDVVNMQYTSGTTGFPKGALLHHRGITNNARLTFARAGVPQGVTTINFAPMFHTSGCACLTLGSAQIGGRMIIAKLFDPPRMLDLIESEHVEFLLGVPTMLIGLLEAQARQPRDVSSVKMALSGGAMVPPELVRRVKSVFGCDFTTVYGQTESSPVVTQTKGDDSLEDLCETVGQPLAQTDISIRDPATNAVAPLGAVGEICARGYCIMLGYNDNPDATAAAIDAEGWLHTGDLGTIDARGYVRVTGRVKEMIIRGGENLFPAEIENILLEHPDVAEVAVVGIPDERWGEIVACFVRLSPGAHLDRNALIAHCRAHIAPQKTPARWIELTDWPLTGSGKIQKFVLRDQLVSGALTDA
jgi:fatty-acyl-CoA synthase